MKNVKEHHLLVIKFCTKNVLYNFYMEKNVLTENVDIFQFSQ